jgi:hypothetical protein
MKKKRLLLLTVLAIALGASIGLAFLRQGPLGPISEERAITIIKAYVVEADNDPHEDIQIDKIELRPPTKSESDYLQEWGKEPPELMWFAKITRFPSWLGPPPENLKWGGYAAMIWLDAHTGEVIYGILLV